MTCNIVLFIKDFIENMDNAGSFAVDLTHKQLTADRKTAYAVVRCLEIIGAASKKCPSGNTAQVS